MKKAIVIGGGIAGLSAAQVLSHHYLEVEIYDNGQISQGQHLHVLLKTGQDILEGFFPGILQYLKERQCPEIDWALDTLWENSNGQFPQYASNMTTLSMGRNLLQESMIERLRSNIKIHKRAVLSLEQVKADLIIIAGGCNFPLKRFFPDLVHSTHETEINLTYRSFIVKTSELNLKDFKQYYFQINPPISNLGGVISPFEDGKSIVTIIEKESSISRCTSYLDFLEKAKSIPGEKFYEIIKDATPINDLAVFRKLNTSKKILNAKKIPKNVFIMGDVIASLNPVFGQGMSVSLMQASLLKSFLEKNTLSSERFYKESLKILRTPYFLSKVGSQEKMLLKTFLDLYLKCCQKFQFLHHIFIHQLHSLKLITLGNK